MSTYAHPTQGYYGGPPSSPPRAYNPSSPTTMSHNNNPNHPNHSNTYDLPPRNTPFISMPPPPRSSSLSEFFYRHQSLLWSLLFWVIFLCIDLFVHHFPKYPYSATRNHSGRNMVVVVYTFVFQVVWLVGVGGKTAWDLGWELRGWWRLRGDFGVLNMLKMGVGLLGCVLLVGWPAVALGVNASVLEKRNRGG
ncbi:hypothetical protein L211DRAFT_837091 [Terfezia boudieri ATCC MYA-4762]|uniref:Uncharacterized protein n=1 Tax=Terfezia boudieri ATCC MYA-4762 TaxID=1051890 RepID=A0A3N4LU21_9PEZI|nr:hypothetical protein L211DRAFT_837091 [Terfezia boudieri ATCC MYA-4762]